MNPLVFAALVPAVATLSWRAPVSPGSPDEARRMLACTIAPAAVYFLLHSAHDRVEGNWLAPLYPASAILAADWVAEARRAGASGFSGAIAKTALWAAPIGLAFAALAFAEALTGAFPLGPADPAVRLEGFRELARDLDLRARAENAAYVLTQGYALTSLMTYYGDPAIAIVQPEQRMRWIFEPTPPETLFAAPGLALGERGRRIRPDPEDALPHGRACRPHGAAPRRRNGRSLRALPGRRSDRPGARSRLSARRGRSGASMPIVTAPPRSIRAGPSARRPRRARPSPASASAPSLSASSRPGACAGAFPARRARARRRSSTPAGASPAAIPIASASSSAKTPRSRRPRRRRRRSTAATARPPASLPGSSWRRARGSSGCPRRR